MTSSTRSLASTKLLCGRLADASGGVIEDKSLHKQMARVTRDRFFTDFGLR
jgi:hypothetical protein